MIIFAHSKCKRYENRKIQGVALPKKERNGQEWKSSHHGTHHGEQDYGAVLLQVVLHSIALESSCQPIGGQEQGSRGNQQGHRAVVALTAFDLDTNNVYYFNVDSTEFPYGILN